MIFNNVSSEYGGEYTGIFIKAALTKVEDISSKISAFLLFVLVVILVYSVISRDFLLISTPWLEEISTLVCVYMVGFGGLAAWIGKKHIAVDLLPRLVSGKTKLCLNFTILVIEICFLSMAALGCWEMMWKSINNTTTALAMSFSFYYLGVFICFFGMLLVSIFRTISRI